MEYPDTLSYLIGRWSVVRSITDHRNAIAGRFVGDAAFIEAAAVPERSIRALAHYDEKGELSFGGHRGTARRHLEYRAYADGSVATFFSDGRKFVDLDLRSGAWRTTHLCGSDHYEITIVVKSSEMFEEHWRVSGPSKDYEAVTDLTRIA